MSELSMFLAGDTHVHRRLRHDRDPRFAALVALVRRADVSFLNLEGTLHDYDPDCYPAAEAGGTYLRSPPYVAEELAWMGFDIAATANNHALDYGYGGLARTLRALHTAGVHHVGTGWSLADARAPAFVECAAGRVGVIAAVSTLPPGTVAGAARPDLQGRPGVNPLRFRKWYGLPIEGIERLRWVAKRLGYGEVVQSSNDREFHFMGRRFLVDSIEGRHSSAEPADAAGNLAAVDAARRQADWVVFSLHAHEGSRCGLEYPADFIVEFSKQAIDAGAHVVMCHGHHGLRGIEVYRGRPIIYGLGSFAFDSELVTKQPPELYVRYGLSPFEGTAVDVYDARRASRARPGEDGVVTEVDETSWLAATAMVEFDGERMRSLQLYPLDLGFESSRARRGRPTLAAGDVQRRTIEVVRQLSRDYGTQIREDGSLELGS